MVHVFFCEHTFSVIRKGIEDFGIHSLWVSWRTTLNKNGPYAGACAAEGK